MQKKRYKDNYGGGLSISKCQTGGFRLKCWIYTGEVYYNKVLKTELACKQQMGRLTDGYVEVKLEVR